MVEAEFMRLNRYNSNAPPSLHPPNNGTMMAQTSQTSPNPNGLPLRGRNFVTVEAIKEAEATTPEADLILFMGMDEKSKNLNIIHSISYFSARREGTQFIHSVFVLVLDLLCKIQ